MINPNYSDLTESEQQELADRLAAGEISRACPRARSDWFRIRLASGRTACGAYRWESETGEFLRFRIR